MPDVLPIPYDDRPQRACPIIAGLQVISRRVLEALLFAGDEAVRVPDRRAGWYRHHYDKIEDYARGSLREQKPSAGFLC